MSWAHRTFEILGRISSCSLRVGYSACFLAQSSRGVEWRKAPYLLLLSSHHISTGFHFLTALTVLLKGKDGIIERGECIISYSLRYCSKFRPKSFSEYCLVRPRWVRCYCLKFCQLFPRLLIHAFARVEHLIRGLLSRFCFCGGVHRFFRDPSYSQLLHFGSFEQLFVEMHRQKGKTILLTAQNSAIKYIQLHASCNFAWTYLNLNEDFAVCSFTVLQNVTLGLGNITGRHCQGCGCVAV